MIVHGAWGGGWEWTPVAVLLRGRGHCVFTPTLTGLGERAHLGGRDVDLSIHVEDVLAVLEYEDLERVVLCGHSSGGMVVTGVADRAPGRVALVIYVDALVPRDGQCALELLPREFGDQVRATACAGRVPIPPSLLPAEGSAPEEVRARYVARLRDMPHGAFTERLSLTGAAERVPRAFVRCTGGELASVGDPIEPHAARARAENWPHRELPASHDPQLTDPAGTADVLDELAAQACGS